MAEGTGIGERAATEIARSPLVDSWLEPLPDQACGADLEYEDEFREMTKAALGKAATQFAKDNDAVYFQLTGALPAREGDGWLIAGQFGEPPVALLILPGERPSYGGQDMRSPDERWQLRRQQTYWVRIGKVRPQGAGKPFLVNARTAPIRVQ